MFCTAVKEIAEANGDGIRFFCTRFAERGTQIVFMGNGVHNDLRVDRGRDVDEEAIERGRIRFERVGEDGE